MTALPAGSPDAGAEYRAASALRRATTALCADAGASIDAHVNVVEPTGSETQILLNIGQQKVTTLFHQRVAALPGETLKILPDARHAHLFDAASGVRLN
jgi:ABC-type sugar transport system ATPase subunit